LPVSKQTRLHSILKKQIKMDLTTNGIVITYAIKFVHKKGEISFQ
jgi:hypothetical protein